MRHNDVTAKLEQLKRAPRLTGVFFGPIALSRPAAPVRFDVELHVA
jgi:hypothetical protein